MGLGGGGFFGRFGAGGFEAFPELIGDRFKSRCFLRSGFHVFRVPGFAIDRTFRGDARWYSG